MIYCKKHLLTSVAGVLMYFAGYAQQNEQANHQKLAESLNSWTQTLPQEKVYLHTDKPYYAIGDTIWFKAYTVVGSRHQLSALSEALYVDLITETGSVEGELKLPLIAGTAHGNFALSSALSEGNYRLRAYTQWMRNAGPGYFYDHVFPVGNAITHSITAGISYEYAREKDKTVLMAVLNFHDAVTGVALSNRKVEYEFRKGIGDHTGRGETDASGSLRFPVPEDFRSGSYIRSVIEKEDGQSFSKTFPVDQGESTDVQFFPEGGELVNGLSSRVAFKATGAGGLGVPVSGFILNDRRDTLSELESLHAGMGFFTLTPEAGQRYHAEINYPDGSTGTLSLPEARETGYVLWAYPYLDNDTLLLRIMAGQNSYGTVNLLMHSGGEVLNMAAVDINRPLTRLRIPTTAFPSGIAAVTLFDGQNRPLCERLVFIRNSDSLHLSLSTDGELHDLRGHVHIQLSAADKDKQATSGSFSVSVIDEQKVPPEGVRENTIFSELLLRSDIRGYVEDPGYYFREDVAETREHLDLLMMTQGYRRFAWKEILENPLPEPEYPAEKLLVPVSGKLLSLGGKPVAGGEVTLFSVSGLMRDTTTDANGHFSFGSILLGKGVSFSVQGRTARGGKKVEVIMNPLPGRQPVTPNPNPGDTRLWIGRDMKTYLANSREHLEDLKKNGMTEQVNMLQGVTVSSKRQSDGIYDMLSGHADQTLRLDNPELCGTLLLCLQGKLAGVTFKSNGTTMVPYSRGDRMAVVLNGRQISNDMELADIFENNALDPADIERIDVIRSNVALMAIFRSVDGEPGEGGALLIKTKLGMTRPAPYSPDITHYAPRGFDIAREFYSPRYDQPRSSLLADLRSTIYWNPSLVTGAEGETAFDFFNADSPGTYRVVVEGINGDGQLGRKVMRYKVD